MTMTTTTWSWGVGGLIWWVMMMMIIVGKVIYEQNLPGIKPLDRQFLFYIKYIKKYTLCILQLFECCKYRNVSITRHLLNFQEVAFFHARLIQS